jgi:hypothetical protein
MRGLAGVVGELDVIDDLTSGAYELPDLDIDDLRTARRVVARHQDLKIGMTDAVSAVLAERYDTNEILTTDQRHFRAIARPRGKRGADPQAQADRRGSRLPVRPRSRPGGMARSQRTANGPG